MIDKVQSSSSASFNNTFAISKAHYVDVISYNYKRDTKHSYKVNIHIENLIFGKSAVIEIHFLPLEPSVVSFFNRTWVLYTQTSFNKCRLYTLYVTILFDALAAPKPIVD